MTEVTRRRILTGVAGTLALFAGCTGGRDGAMGGGGGLGGGSGSGGSETYGRVTVTVDHHVRAAEYATYDEDGQPCVQPVESGRLLLSVVVRIETGDIDLEPLDTVETSTLDCDGELFDLSSVSVLSSEGGPGEAFEVGFEVPEGLDASSCELELRWQGDSSSEESFRFGLGPERNPDLPKGLPRCNTAKLRESFAVQVTLGGEEHLLFDADDVSMVGQVEEANGSYRILITLSDEGADKVEKRLRDTGVLDSPGDARILVELDGEVVMDLGMSPELAEQVDSGEWDGQLLLLFEDRETVETVRDVLLGR